MNFLSQWIAECSSWEAARFTLKTSLLASVCVILASLLSLFRIQIPEWDNASLLLQQVAVFAGVIALSELIATMVIIVFAWRRENTPANLDQTVGGATDGPHEAKHETG